MYIQDLKLLYFESFFNEEMSQRDAIIGINILLACGFVLVFLVTPALFLWYATTEQAIYSKRRWPMPIISDMFGDWPMLSSASMGLGISIQFTGISWLALLAVDSLQNATLLCRLCVAVQSSVWVVIPTSLNHGFQDVSTFWAHNVSTLIFIASSVWALQVCNGMVRDWSSDASYRTVGLCVAVCCFCVGLAGISVLLISATPGVAWQLLAVSEYVLFTSSALGYALLLGMYKRAVFV
jgi:hypothetical protein